MGYKTSPVPPRPLYYMSKFFLNGSTTNLNVDGSSSPVNYDITPDSGQIWYIESLKIFLEDPGVMASSSFGSISGLTNGLRLSIKTDGTEYESAIIKTNIDLVLVFGDTTVSMAPGASNQGFLNEEDFFSGSIFFDHAAMLDQSKGDFVRMKVQDDLTGVYGLYCSAKLWRAP